MSLAEKEAEDLAIHKRFTLWAVSSLLIGCGASVGANGHDVGANCTTDRDCAVRCSHDGDFGGAMCTRPCATDHDCPNGAVCVTTDNGMCAVACQTNNDCAGFGRAFACANKSRQGGGTVLVCRVP
jgi:hypothetical protein